MTAARVTRGHAAGLLAMLVAGVVAQRKGRPTPRIVGGNSVQRFEYPFLARVYGTISFSNSGVCGASLVASDWVLTAAHCFEGLDHDSVYVGIHRHQIWSGSTNEHSCAEVIKVSAVRCHPSYDDDPENGNDICLLQLSRPPRCSIPVVRLDDGAVWPTDSIAPLNNAQATVAGWGTTGASETSPSSVPLQAQLNLYTVPQCQHIFDIGAEYWPLDLFGRSNGAMQCSGLCAPAPREAKLHAQHHPVFLTHATELVPVRACCSWDKRHRLMQRRQRRPSLLAARWLFRAGWCGFVGHWYTVMWRPKLSWRVCSRCRACCMDPVDCSWRGCRHWRVSTCSTVPSAITRAAAPAAGLRVHLAVDGLPEQWT